MACLSGEFREDLNSFFWRQVVAKSPDYGKASPDYEKGWNAINEFIRADYTWSGYERNVVYANNRDGTFSDVSGAVGLDFLEDGRAFALADFDRDGRQEMVVKNRTAPQLRLMKNVLDDLPPAIAFRLRGVKSNRDAIGAVVTVETEAGRQTRTLQAGSGFLSQHSKDLFFGLGQAKGPVRGIDSLAERPRQELHDLPLDHLVHVEEGAAPARLEPFRSPGSHGQPKEDAAAALPATGETWLLAPVPAPTSLPPPSRNQPALLHFGSRRRHGMLGTDHFLSVVQLISCQRMEPATSRHLIIFSTATCSTGIAT